jgi:hypothetical protein
MISAAGLSEKVSAQAGKEYTEVTEKGRNTETLIFSKARMENNGNRAFSVFSVLFGGSVYRKLKPG